MARALRACAEPGCPNLIPAGRTRCIDHARQVDRARGTRQARGYDARHDALRRRWAVRVRRGDASCARCGEPIDPDEPWDLGHTDDRTGWTGPEHANRCNRSAGGKAAH